MTLQNKTMTLEKKNDFTTLQLYPKHILFVLDNILIAVKSRLIWQLNLNNFALTKPTLATKI